jgi:hypothetical protein
MTPRNEKTFIFKALRQFLLALLLFFLIFLLINYNVIFFLHLPAESSGQVTATFYLYWTHKRERAIGPHLLYLIE